MTMKDESVMTRSPLYLSFGMPKSGSTLAFQLTRTLLELAGVAQDKIAEGITAAETKINFVQKLDGSALDKLLDEAVNSPGPRVIKTHSRIFPRVEAALKHGAIIGHAVCRDPRDIALSMLDAARENRDWGASQEGPYQMVADTEKRLHTSVNMFLKWAATPNVMVICYERLAFDTESVAAEIAAQLGITVDIPRAIEIVTGSRFTQFNRGRSQRWKTEMDPTDASRLEVEFKDYIEAYCQDVPTRIKTRKPRSGWLKKWLARNSYNGAR
jgi:hypothetical protein